MEAASDVAVDIVQTDEYQFIIDYWSRGVEFVEVSSGVKGCLTQCVSYWESTTGAPWFVLDVIFEGYKLPFIKVPASCYIRNNPSAENHPSFVEEAISKLLVNNCI